MMTKAKDVQPFPIPLDGFISRWAKDGTLRNRLRAVIAQAVEAETGNVVLVNSYVDDVIRDALDEIMRTAKSDNGRMCK